MSEKSKSKQRLLTGLQPSGTLHLGNYFGALKPLVDAQVSYESFVMVADYHALTTLRDPDALREHIIQGVKDYIAAGIDPTQMTIFQQSRVPEHTELAWVLNCLVTVPFLMQAHAYKDKVEKGIEASAGLFTYPMLMAADILLYDADIVPVGEDQRQHVEYAREAATKFNNAYTPLFTQPKETILKSVGTVPGTDGQKMSKSYKNTIPLFAPREEIQKAVMSIVTDSNGDVPEHVYALHNLIKTEEELAPLYEQHKGKYKDLKEALVDDLEEFFGTMRERRAAISDEDVRTVLAEGSERARDCAKEKMRQVRDVIGISI